MSYSTKTEVIFEKHTLTANVVTKWVFKTILQNRAESGDLLAKEYLEHIERSDTNDECHTL